MTESIIGGPLFRIREHRVGLCRFLEAFLRLWIVGILVRMVLDGELSVGRFYLCLGSIL